MKGKGQITKSSVKATSVAAGSSEGSWHRPPAYLRQGPDTSLRELPVSFVSFLSRWCWGWTLDNLPASPRATWRKMERSCLRTEIRSSCKHLSKVSDDRQGYLQSVKGFKVLNSINPPHLILVGRDQPLERVSDHRKRDGSRGESCNVWFQRCRQ